MQCSKKSGRRVINISVRFNSYLAGQSLVNMLSSRKSLRVPSLYSYLFVLVVFATKLKVFNPWYLKKCMFFHLHRWSSKNYYKQYKRKKKKCKRFFGQTSVSRACLHDIKRLSQVIVWLNGYLVTVCTCKQSWSMCQCQGLMTVDEGSKNLILYLLMCWFQFWFSLWSKSAVLLVAIIMYLSAGN